MNWLKPCLLVLAVAFSSTALTANETSEPLALSHGRTFEEQGGEALYAHVCAACHQQDGRGAIGAGAYPPLSGNPNLESAEALETLIFKGRRDMPAVGRMMSDKQVADLINYLEARFGAGSSAAVTEADVAAARQALLGSANP